MEKKILLAVDGSIHSRHAIHYAVNMSSVVKDLTYTLFHVQSAISQFLLDEAKTDYRARTELKRLVRKNAELASSMLEKYKARMVRMGVDEKRINVTTQPRLLGIAADALERAQQELYDAIVVGRRGLSRVQKTFMGSVTASLVEHSRIVPVWVVDGNVASMKIMLAADGSESSLRAVDHLSFMVGANPKIKLKLFHIMPRLRDYCSIRFDEKDTGIEEVITRGARRCIEGFYDHALKRLGEVGIGKNQIEIKVSRRILSVGKAIVDEAKKGGYGTVVIGRRGVSKAFLMGSVSRYVMHGISNRALWLVP